MAEIEKLIRFDHQERETLNSALTHIRIAFPEWPESPHEGSGDEMMFRALKAATTKNNLVNARQVEMALRAMEVLVHELKKQADLPYWRDQLKADREAAPGLEPRVAGTGGIPLIGNPQDFCRMLAETREWQLREAEEAYALLGDGLGALGAGL